MRVGIFLDTPAQVHFYKNIAKGLEKKDHEILFLVRDYGETIELLNELGLSYLVYYETKMSRYSKITGLPFAVYKAARQLLRFKADIVTGFCMYSVFSAFFSRKPCIVFYDSEPRVHRSLWIQFKLIMPLLKAIITPSSFADDLGPKQIRVNSCKELAYLNPDCYKPDEEIFDLLKLGEDEDYAVVRFNSFDATHDVGVKGFRLQDKIDLINMLSEYTNVFVSFEGAAPKEIEKYRLKTPKKRIHDVLYYAKLLVADTQTMSMEAAVLGTPVVRTNSFVGENDLGYLVEAEKKYGLVFNFQSPKEAIEKTEELIQNPNLKREWENKREKLLKDKNVDIVQFMVNFIEKSSG